MQHEMDLEGDEGEMRGGGKKCKTPAARVLLLVPLAPGPESDYIMETVQWESERGRECNEHTNNTAKTDKCCR